MAKVTLDSDPNAEKFCIDHTMTSSIENMPNIINGNFEIQKYLLLGENQIQLQYKRNNLKQNILTKPKL